MPFKSKSQLRACFAKNDPDWNCEEWASKTKNVKKLPDAVKKSSEKIASLFFKIAKDLFDPEKSPIVPATVLQAEIVREAKAEKTKGMTPSEYRRELTKKRTGIFQKNKQSARVIKTNP